MTMRFRRLELRAATGAGNIGATIDFTDGLNVLAAPNTSGKSTCVMAMLYALGLEGMLSPSHQPPLPDAMLRSVIIDDSEVSVVSSHVRMEIENSQRERLTVTRRVTGTVQERQLIRGVLGPDLTQPSDDYQRRDFYVRMSGAAQNEAGFHRYLADFVGLELPRVPGVEAETVPLYLECLFPFFLVDQLTGWRDIKARMPTYLRIPEMAKRSTEYILALDILRRAMEKQQLEQRLAGIKTGWSDAVEKVKAELASHNVVLRGMPETPQAIWPPTPSPQVLLTDGQEWISLSAALQNIRERQQAIVEEEIPRAEQVSQQVISDLRKSEEELDSLTDRLGIATKDLMNERAHVSSINTRLRALEDDFEKYHDLKRILDRGGEVELQTASSLCPTCHQEIKDALLPQEKTTTPMTLEENIEFIRDQIATFSSMRRDAIEVLEARETECGAISERINSVNVQIRAQKKTLHSDGRVPSVAAVREHLQLDGRADTLQAASDKFGEFLERMSALAQEWVQVCARLQSLASTDLSDVDSKKLAYLQTSLVEQLREYSFRSFLIDHISISRESYRPTRDDYDIGLTSASDTIRMIWAYLVAMLEVDRKFTTNHLGFLVFDEPRQQGTETVSFDALLKRAAQSATAHQQVIFTTSEEKSTIEAILSPLECTYIPFDGKILRPL